MKCAEKNLIFISEGEAQPIFDVDVTLEDMPSMYINRLAEDYRSVLSMPQKVSMGEMAANVIGRYSYVIPRISSHGTHDIKIGGAAVLLGKNNKMIGWLSEEDTEGYNLVIGEAEHGMLQVPYEEDELFAFEIMDLSSDVTYERKQGEDHFHVKIKTEGVFSENWIDNIDINNQKKLKSAGRSG